MKIMQKDTITSLEVLMDVFDYFDDNLDRYSEYNVNPILNFHYTNKDNEDFNIDKFILFLFKEMTRQETVHECFLVLDLYSHMAYKYNIYDKEISFSLYELIQHLDKDRIIDEKHAFAGIEHKINKIIPSFEFIKKEFSIKGKRIDVLGKCMDTGKNIIVEYKNIKQSATHQLYSYDRLMGVNNILVCISTHNVKNKCDDIIYILKKDLEFEGE